VRAVVDTNVLVSALLQPLGTPGLVLERFRRGDYRLVLTSELLAELQQVVRRPRLQHRIALDAAELTDVLDQIAERADFVQPTTYLAVCRDADDDRVLEAAVDGRADIIASGDDDLLALDPFGEVRVVRPADFLRMLDADPSETTGG
jgi:putative PIN family toxin of toxin-antitoxin system